MIAVGLGKLGNDGVGGDADGAPGAAQGVFDHGHVLVPADDDADRRVLALHAFLGIEGFQVEFHLALVLGLEAADLQLYGHQAAESAMKEQEVDEVLVATDLDAVLVADEREGATHFGQKTAQVVHQGAFQLAFGVLFGQIQEVEGVVVLHG